MTALVLGGGLATLLFVHLVVALIHPERFS